MKRTALAISGGGSKGAFAIGAVEVLRERGFKFDIVSGTSTGALIAPLIAIDDINTAAKLYTSIKNSDILRHNWRKLYWNAIYDTKPLENLIRKNISENNRYERLMRSSCAILLCTVSLQSRKVTYFSQHDTLLGTTAWRDQDEFVRAVLGSTNQPAIMPAIKIDGEQYVDGGVREITPLEILIKADVERIVVIMNSPAAATAPETKQYGNMASVGLRALDVMSTEIGNNDVRHMIAYNDLLTYVHNTHVALATHVPPYRVERFMPGFQSLAKPREIIVIRPEESLGFSGLEFDPKNMQKAREVGQATARKVLNG